MNVLSLTVPVQIPNYAHSHILFQANALIIPGTSGQPIGISLLFRNQGRCIFSYMRRTFDYGHRAFTYGQYDLTADLDRRIFEYGQRAFTYGQRAFTYVIPYLSRAFSYTWPSH